MLIRQHLSLIKMNVYIFSLKIWKSFVGLHGIRDWKKVVLPRLAMITQFPPIIQTAFWAVASLLENRNYDRENISKRNQFSVILENRVREKEDVIGNLIQDSEQFSHCSIYFSYEWNESVKYLRIEKPLTFQ